MDLTSTEFVCVYQWRIQDFPQGGAPTPKSAIIFQFFAENCMKMKEFGPPGGGARVPGAPPWIRQCIRRTVCRPVHPPLDYRPPPVELRRQESRRGSAPDPRERGTDLLLHWHRHDSAVPIFC